jgi:2-polyprenyl-6-methoxyphenol hydroxylase-like FAD-dependent oxidoreductase
MQGFSQDDGGVTVYLADNRTGGPGRTTRADALICADGIHSAGRRAFYPDERREPEWNGVQMWRGAAIREPWRDGESMAIGGGLGGKFVLYPIAPPEPDGRQLMNWVVNVRTKDPEISKPPEDSWTRRASQARVLPHGMRFIVPGYDIAGLIRATDAIFEYPMADRDPLPHWTFGRVTLLGDAAHPMYPVGSNGASQAILDARCLADNLAQMDHPRAALWHYERTRLPKTAEIARQNRSGGPEAVIDEVEKRAPAGFRDIDDVLSHAERQRIVRGYAMVAGFARVTRD